MRIAYLDGARLRAGLIAGCEYVQARRAELNRINVFPVPDGDTGTNLALTASSIADGLRSSRDAAAGAVARQAAEAAILGARGNCGMILSHFLLGFAESADAAARLDARAFGSALRVAVDHVYRALERPVEGTIVTVMRETAEAAQRVESPDFVDVFDALLRRARTALERTPELLPALRRAGVVDAGAKGFVHLLEGVAAYIRGDPIAPLAEPVVYAGEPAAVAQAEYPAESERFRFCTEALVRGGALPEAGAVRAALAGHGDSLIVLRSGDVLKVHVHTDDPEAVFALLRGMGTLATHKAEDMEAQHEAIERAAASHVQLARRPVAVVSDSGCDLPDEVLRAHGIRLVPLSLVTESGVLRDRVDIDAEAFNARLLAGEHPSTSQPPPAAFLETYARAAEDGEAIVAVMLSAALSGTFASAEAAARRFEGAPVTLVDSRGASLTQGFLTLKAAELAELGETPDSIARELERIRDQSGLFFTVDTFENLIASGRVGRGRAWLGSLLDIKPILGLSRDGRILPVAKVRGASRVLPRMMELLAERVPPDVGTVRFGILHVARSGIVAEVAAALRERYGEREIISAPATPVLATHLGPGAWGLIYHVED